METGFEIDPALRASLLEDGENIDDVELQLAMMEEFENSRRAQLEEQRYQELLGHRQYSAAIPSAVARDGALGNASNHASSPSVTAALTRSDDIQETNRGRSSSSNQNLSQEREASKSPVSRQSRSSSNAGSVSNRSDSVSEYNSCDELDTADGPSASPPAAAAAFDSDGEEIDEITEEKRRQHAACEEFYKYTSKPIAVTANDEMYMQIIDDFTKNNLTVVEVYKVYNSTTRENFEEEAAKLLRQNPELSEDDLNMKWLYHGSQAPLKELCDESLDIRFSRMGRFGRGIYFSDEPAKCVNYAAIDETRVRKYILYCRVLLGCIKEYKPGECDKSLVRPPKKGVVNNNTIYYNSVKGKPHDYTEFVIYDNFRAHIEYFIFYRNDASTVPRPRKTRNNAQSLDEESNTTETWLHQSHIVTTARPSNCRKNRSSAGPLALPASERPSARRRLARSDQDESEQAGPSRSEHSSGSKQEKERTVAMGGAANVSRFPVDLNDSPQTVATRQEGFKEQLSPQSPPQSQLNAASQLEASNPEPILEQNARTAAASWLDEDATDGMLGTPQTQVGTERTETSAEDGMALETVTADSDLCALMDAAISEFMTCTNITEHELARDYVLRAKLDSQKAVDLFFQENY